MMKSLFALAVILFFFIPAIAEVQDSLRHKLQSNLSEEQEIEVFIDLSGIYADQLKFDSAYYFATKAIEKAQSSELPEKEADAFYALGYSYDLAGRLADAVANYEMARYRYELLDIKEQVATCMNSKGVASYFKGDFERALDFYLETLSYTEEHNIESVMVNTLNNLGVIYRVTNKNKEAIKIYHKTLALSQRTKHQNMVGTSYHNLGVAYNFDSVLDSALIYFDSAVLHYQAINDNFEVGRILTAIGETYYLTGKNYNKAREYLSKGEKYLSEVQSDQEVLSKTYLLHGQVERDDNQFDKSLEYFNKGLALIEGTEREELILDYYREIEVLYNKTGDPQKAHEYLSKYIHLYKKIQSIEKINAIEELQTKYETQQKEQEIILLNNKNELSQIKLNNTKNLTFILSIGLIMLSAFIYWLYVLNKKIKKSSDEKETLLREIHHRVKNNLQVISALLTLQSKYIKDEHAIEALRQGQDRVQSMALIHKDLYQHNNLKGVNTKDYLEKLIDNLIESYNVDTDNLDLDINIESLWLDVDTMIPMGLMINELISNALKHAFVEQGHGKLSISLHEKGKTLQLVISDNGKGMPNFENQRAKSFGYSLINSFAKKLDADLQYRHDEGLCIEMNIKEYVKTA